jgi:hypothetical protein
MSFPTPSGNAPANTLYTQQPWWVVSYYTIYGRTTSAIQFTTVQATSQASAIAKAKIALGSHASNVGQLVKGPFGNQNDANSNQNTSQQDAASGKINPSGGPAGQPTNFSNAVSDVFGKFNLGSWFLRIGEILLGIVLVGVGLARITGVQNAISQIVKTKMPIPI